MIDPPRDSDEPASLLSLWERALRFSIGVGEEAGIYQLPHTECLPDVFLTDDPAAGDHLGEVFGVAALKLFRPWPMALGKVVALDTLGFLLEDLAESDCALDRARLRILSRVLDMAMHAPERLPVLISRLDALTNDDLHRMAMDAVQGRVVAPDVFKGLME